MAGGTVKALTGDTEGMINDFINKIANKKVSKEVAEYNKNKEIITVLGINMISMILAFKESSGETPEEKGKFEKLMKKLQETEMYKRFEENSKNDENSEKNIRRE